MLLLCTQWLLMHLLYFSSLVVIISSEKGPRPKFSFVCPWHFSLSNQVFIVDILLQEYWLSTHLVKYPLFYDGLQVIYQQFFLLLEKLLMIEIPLCKGNKMQAVFQIFFFLVQDNLERSNMKLHNADFKLPWQQKNSMRNWLAKNSLFVIDICVFLALAQHQILKD